MLQNVIFVKRYINMEGGYLERIKRRIRYYFSMRERDSDETIIAAVHDGISFQGSNLWVLIFAIFLASLGLNVNSTAVIIGAMLISPLMGPIIGIGLSVGINDFDLLKKSLKNYTVATIISVLTATVYFIISPYSGVQSELLARTSPTLYDVLIALFGGAAGIVALSKGGKGNVIPGVAIATALMPPLCTAGYGLAHWNAKFFLGAAYLYFINCVFIAVATYLGSRMMHFKHIMFIEKKNYSRVRKYIIGIVAVTIIPAVFMTVKIVRDGYFDSHVNTFISKEMKISGTQIVQHNVNKNEKILELVAVGREIPVEHISKAAESLSKYKLDDYKLVIIQGTQSDSILKLNNELLTLETSSSDKDKTIQEQALEITALEEKLKEANIYNDLSSELLEESTVFFKQIRSINLAEVTESIADGTHTNIIQAVIGTYEGTELSDADIMKLKELITRKCNFNKEPSEIKEVRVIVNRTPKKL